MGKYAKMWGNPRRVVKMVRNPRKFTRSFTKDLHGVLHKICTELVGQLSIDGLLDSLDLVAEVEIEFEIRLDFADAVHNGSVIFDTNLAGDFGSTHGEFFTEDIHSNLASGLDMGDAGFAAHFFDAEVVVFGDTFDDLLATGGARPTIGVGEASGTTFD